MPEHKGIYGKEIGDQLARIGSLHPFIKPDPTCGVPGRVKVPTTRDRVYRKYQKCKQSTLEQNHSKGLPIKHSTIRNTKLLNLSKFQNRQVTQLLRERSPKRHLVNSEKISNPICRCYCETGAALHTLYDCEALATQDFCR